MVTLVLCFFREISVEAIGSTFYASLNNLFFFLSRFFTMLFYPEKPEEIPVDISQRLHETKTQNGVISGVVTSTSSNSGTSFNATHVPLGMIVQPMENYGKYNEYSSYRQFPRDRSWLWNERAHMNARTRILGCIP